MCEIHIYRGKNMKKALLYVVLLLTIIVGVMAYNIANHTPVQNAEATPTPEPWMPAQLHIPDLHIDAPVINVEASDTGVMEAPTSKALHSPYWTSVFWYAPGVAPGQTGNAVIAGHVDRVGGDPAIFWSLNSMKLGDIVSVETLEGKSLQFMVKRVVTYPATAPSQDVINAIFGPTSEHHLNLITCSGVWTAHGYDARLVVFTTQVN